ncbi:HD family phosphohydrolase [Desulfocurvus vexinensis]|uniref:HD family phosphohydrolase n=1 Tax=Desulfocurvus vexinensis TaxID=399548 RepID=UPI0004B6B483|nr:HDIG domain-containing metalloprotein [Desulfocurvus vexinensis]
MNVSKKPTRKKPSAQRTARDERARARDTRTLGVALFLLVLLGLSALAGVRMESGPPAYTAGDIADTDVIARRDFLIEDMAATLAKRRRAAEAQPPVFDLSRDALRSIDAAVHDVFGTLDAATPEAMEDVRWQIAEDLNAEIGKATLALWQREDFQNLVLARVLPWVGEALARGVVEDASELSRHEHGIILRDMAAGEETMVADPEATMDITRLRAALAAFLKDELKKPLTVRKAVWTLLAPLLEPSLTLDREETRARADRAMAAVQPVYFHVRQGEILVRHGEAVTLEQQIKLQAMAAESPRGVTVLPAAGIFALAALMGLGLLLCRRAGLCPALQGRDYVLLSVLAVVFCAGAKFLALIGGPLTLGSPVLTKEIIPYSLPLAGASGVAAMFFPLVTCFFVTLLLAFFCAQILGGGLTLFSFFFATGLLYAFVIKQAESRKELLASVLPLLAGLSLAWVGANFLDYQGLAHALAGGAYVLAGGFVSLVLLLALSPMAEYLLGYVSRFRLMELMSLEQPLLQELMVSAPGSYHHSLVLSNMVEAGARAIGANPLLARVAALYHDVGKVTKPQYFVENQMGGENRHDKLAPSMSALILTSHVKQGVELARTHKLGAEIEDLIRQHHGTMLISFFYHKACEQAEARGEAPPREDEFRYPGPKPQTKEAGLLLLADAIEASSRTLVEPTPSRIKGHIEKLIKKIFSDGQLDESALTLKDLHELSEVFLRILTGIFHQRIEYPGGDNPQLREDARARTEYRPESAFVDAPPPEACPEPRSGHKPEQDPTGQSCPADARDAGTVLKFTKRRGAK